MHFSNVFKSLNCKSKSKSKSSWVKSKSKSKSSKEIVKSKSKSLKCGLKSDLSPSPSPHITGLMLRAVR